MNRNLPWSDSTAQKYIVRHSNTVLSLIRLIMGLQETKDVHTKYIFVGGSETAPWEISVHTRVKDSQASRFFGSRNYYLRNYAKSMKKH